MLTSNSRFEDGGGQGIVPGSTIPPMTEPEPATESPDPAHRRSDEVAGRIAASRRRWRRAILIPLGLVLACLLAGEIAARASGIRPNARLVAAGERGWGMKSGAHTVDGATATVSQSGTRGPEASPGGLLVLGDEIAFGPGLADGETAAAVLARASGLPATLAACDGYGTAQEALWLRDLAPRLKPRAVVVLFASDDPRPFASTLFTSLRFRLQSVSALAAGAFPGARPTPRGELPPLYHPDGIPWKLLEDSVRDIGRWSRENRTPVLFAIWPWMSKQDDALGEYLEQVRGAARAEGLVVCNLLEALGSDGLDRLLLPNGRPNADAHRRVGELLAVYVKDVLAR